MPRVASRVPFGGGSADLEVVQITPGSEPAAGPVVVVTANVHGDECTGTGAVLRLMPLLAAELQRGTVLLYPSLNPDGLERRQRRVPEDDQDLNRQFPGDAGGAPAERRAALAWGHLSARRPDLLIDLHADAPGALPYVILDRAVAVSQPARASLEAASHAFALTTGLTVIHEYPDDRYKRFRLDRSLTGAVLNHLRVPALTIEAGPRLILEVEAVDTMVRAVMAVLADLRMVRAPEGPLPPKVPGGPWRREAGPRASTSGVLVARVRPGVVVHPGAAVAEVRALSGALLEEIVAEHPGFVLAAAERSHVVPGVSVCTWAVAEPS